MPFERPLSPPLPDPLFGGPWRPLIFEPKTGADHSPSFTYAMNINIALSLYLSNKNWLTIESEAGQVLHRECDLSPVR